MENWKDIPELEGRYQVSDQGNVMSLIGRKSRLLRGTFGSDGYRVVSLMTADGKAIKRRVSRLVLSAFDRLPEDGEDACHRNGQPTDDRLVNLRWGTRSENMADCRAHGTDNRGSRHWSTDLTEDDVREIRRLAAEGVAHRELAARYGMQRASITAIACRLRWKHVL